MSRDVSSTEPRRSGDITDSSPTHELDDLECIAVGDHHLGVISTAQHLVIAFDGDPPRVNPEALEDIQEARLGCRLALRTIQREAQD